MRQMNIVVRKIRFNCEISWLSVQVINQYSVLLTLFWRVCSLALSVNQCFGLIFISVCTFEQRRCQISMIQLNNKVVLLVKTQIKGRQDNYIIIFILFDQMQELRTISQIAQQTAQAKLGASSGEAPKARESGESAGGGPKKIGMLKSSANGQALQFAHDTHQSSILLLAPSGSEHSQLASPMSQTENNSSAASTAMEVATIVRLPLSESVQQQQSHSSQQATTESQQIESSGSASSSSLFQSLDSQKARQVQHKIYANSRQAESNNPLAATFEVMKEPALQEEPLNLMTHTSYLDTHTQPQCLRFSPGHSSQGVHISMSGLTAQATAANQHVLGNIAFSEGVHYWEFICPIAISSIDFGVQSIGSNPNTIQVGFRSTTPRSIIIVLDLRLQKIDYWLNGRHLKKERTKKLTQPGLAWRPYIKFKEPNFVVVMNPFCKHPPTNPQAVEERSKLCDNIYSDLSYSQISYLEAAIGNVLLVMRLPKNAPNSELQAASGEGHKTSVQEKLGKIAHKDAQIEIIEAPAEQKVATAENVAVLRFKSRPDMIDYLRRAVAAQISIFGPREIARLLHQCTGKTAGQITTMMTDAYEKDDLPQSEKPCDLGQGNVPGKVGVNAYKIFSKFLDTELLGPTKVAQTFNRVLAGISNQAVSSEQISTQVKDALNFKPEESKANQVGSVANDTQISYLKQADKLLIANGSELKVFSSDLSNQASNDWSSFSNFARELHDTVALSLPQSEMKFLFSHIDWSLMKEDRNPVISDFLTSLGDKKSYDGSHIRMPYDLAFESLQTLLEVAVAQYRAIESVGMQLQKSDKLKKPQVIAKSEEGTPISFDEANTLLSILLGLEDQLWAMTQSDQVSSRVKAIWPCDTARVHTAFGRLSSLLSLPDSDDPVKLAELGLVNTQDQMRKLELYQEPEVDVESIYELSEQGRHSLALSLEKQFVNNMLLKGQRTWNVPLAQTLNYLPPQVHRNFLPPATQKLHPKKEQGKIDVLKTVTSSTGYALSGSLEDGSVNVWSTQLGLNLAGGFNFKKQVHSEPSQVKEREELPMLSMQLVGNAGSNESHMYVRDKKFSGFVPKEQKTEAPIEEKEVAVEVEPEIKEEGFDDPFGFNGLFPEEADKEKPASDQIEVESAIDLDEDYEHMNQESSLFEILMSTNLAYGTPTKGVAESELGHKEEVKKETTSAAKSAEEAKKEALVAELTKNLTDMGFPIPLAEAAVKASKQLLLPDVLDKVIVLQEEEKKKNPDKHKPKQYKPYSCATCTFYNKNPNANCEMCMSPAPPEAIVEAGPTPEELALQEKVKDEARKEQERIEKQKQWEADEKVKEEARKAELKEIRLATEQYYMDSNILDFVFASHMGGQSTTPLVSGAIFHNTVQNMCDIHLLRFKYTEEYRSQVERDYITGGVNCPAQSKQFGEILRHKQSSVESYYPALVGTDQCAAQKDVRQTRMALTLRPSKIGTVRLPFEKVDVVCQIGDDLTKESSMYVLVVGKKPGQSQQTTALVSVDYRQSVLIVSDDFKPFTDLTKNKTVNSLVYVQESKCLVASLDNDETLAMQFVKDSERGIELKLSEVAAPKSYALAYESHGIMNSAGNEFVATSQRQQESQANQQEESKSEGGSQQLQTSEDVMKMRIDPAKVTSEDIELYEKMMLGAVTLARSNANHKVGQASDKSVDVYAKHTWTRDTSEAENIGAFEMQFECPTSLVNLKLALNFASCDLDSITKSHTESSTSQSIPVAKEVEDKQTEIDTTSAAKTHSNAAKLGLFSTEKRFDLDAGSQQQATAAKTSEESKDSYLPLVVKRFKGATYSQGFVVSRVLFDDNSMYASNYGKPELVFAHANNDRMSVDKVCLRSQTRPKSGAFPIGEGLIFLSDTLQPLEHTAAFSNFGLKEYQEWKDERMKDPRPLRADEPVAFFQFDAETRINVDIDFKRSSRYIMLKPTGLRKKPQAFTQAVDITPIEIEFFGAVGTSSSENSLDAVRVNDHGQNEASAAIRSGFDVEVRLMGSNEVVSTLKNVAIDQLKVTDASLSTQTITESKEFFSNRTKVQGLSLLNIADSKLQQQKVSGIIVTLVPTETKQWSFSSASMEAISSQGTSSKPETEILFQNKDIPAQYYRTCLMSPDFFPVINGQIASIVSQQDVPERLRLQAITFLKKLISTDSAYTPLIFAKINLDSFLQCNMLDADQASISRAADLLQSFQKLPEFCTSLYKILIAKIETITENVPQHGGYEVIMGMLKWAAPLDNSQTYKVILQALYHKVVHKQLKEVQTREVIEYRTRYATKRPALDHYPFDSIYYNSEEASAKSSDKGAQEKESSPANDQRDIDLLRMVKLSKADFLPKVDKISSTSDQTLCFDATFYGDVSLRAIKLYFQQPGAQKNSLFNVTVSVWDKTQCVYFQNYPQHTYYQMATHAALTDKKTGKELPLTISQLSHRCSSLKVVVQFDNTLSHMTTKFIPKVLMEFYGATQATDALHFAMDLNTAKASKQTMQVGNSIKMYLGKEGEIIPEESASFAQQPRPEKAQTDNEQQIDTTDKKEESQPAQAQTVSEGPSALSLVQDELRGELRTKAADDVVADKVKAVVAKLKEGKSNSNDRSSLKSLKYLIQLSSDFTKMLRFIQNQAGSESDLNKDSLREILTEVTATTLPNAALAFFEHLVVYESMKARADGLSFIQSVIVDLMTDKEKNEFYFEAIERFLVKPQSHYSQLAVVQGLNEFEIPLVDLMQYLAKKIGIEEGAEASSASTFNPIALLPTVLTLLTAPLDKAKLKYHNELPEVSEDLQSQFDASFRIMFRAAEWVSNNAFGYFSQKDQTALLSMILGFIKTVGKVVSPSVLKSLATEASALQTCFLKLMCLNEKNLLTLYMKATAGLHMRTLREAKRIHRSTTAEQLAKANEKAEKLRVLGQKTDVQLEQIMEFKESLNQLYQQVLQWLILMELDPEQAKKEASANELISQCEASRGVWLQHINFTIDAFIDNQSTQRNLMESKEKIADLLKKSNEVFEKTAAEKGDAPQQNEEEDLKPLPMSRSDSVEVTKEGAKKDTKSSTSAISLVKSFIQIINQQSGDHGKQGSNFKYLSQIWALALRSLRIVHVHELAQAKIFDELISAFLKSSQEIQQTTFPQLLSISEKIAQDQEHGGRFLVSLLFMTLDSVSQSVQQESVAFSICQGWLDIMIHSTCTALPKKYEKESDKWPIYTSLEAQDVGLLLSESTKFLLSYLNFCNFEGSAGANQLVVRRLSLARNMLYIAWNAYDKDKKQAISGLFSGAETDEPLQTLLKKSFDGLLLWLFMNERSEIDEASLKPILVFGLNTPATEKVREISELIHPLLMFVSDSDKNTQAIKIALSSLMNVVRAMNKGLLRQVQNDNIGHQTSHQLSTRTCSIFQKLLNQWLVADSVVNYFVFELKGFEFLLDTIGTSATAAVSKLHAQEESKDIKDSNSPDQPIAIDTNEAASAQQQESLEGSDLAMIFSQQHGSSSKSDKPAAKSNASDPFKSDANKDAEMDENVSFDVQLEEFAKTMQLTEETFENAPKNHGTVDWSINKKPYKHRQMYKFYKEQDCFEHYLTFKLSTPAELREIQIGFVFYWQVDSEIYIEPLSVLVEAGMDQDNLVHVCNLDPVTDPAFATQNVQIFGKNLRQFSSNEEANQAALASSEAMQNTVFRKLDSIYNFRCQYVKFSFRRNVMSCLENSPLANRIGKKQTFSINYISVTGQRMDKMTVDMQKYVLKLQKKSALEIMSIICSGDFASVLKVIANQKETIDKIKDQFDLLTTFVGQKQDIIEPTLIGISTHNQEMGDWIIHHFISQDNMQRFGHLIGKIIVCDPKKVAQRLDVLLEKILSALQEIKEDKQMQNKRIEQTLPLIDIYTRTMHLIAPDLCSQKDSTSIEVKVKAGVLMDVFQLLTTATEERARQSEKLRQFISTVLCPPEPFINTEISQIDFAQEVLLEHTPDISQEVFDQMQLIAGTLACQNSAIATILFQKRLNLDKLSSEITSMSVARFWLNAAHDSDVRKALQDEGLPAKLYSFLREDDPVTAKRVMKTAGSKEYRELIVQLIKYVSAGHRPSELALAEFICKDIPHLESNRDEFFIDYVLLPFIKNEQCLPISFIQQLELSPEELADGKPWSPNFDLLAQDGQSQSQQKKEKAEDNSTFVPSELLEPAMRKNMLKAFREIVGKHSKSKMDSALTAKWECVHTQTQKEQDISHFAGFWEKIAEKGPCVFLCSGKSNGNKVLLGGYTSNQMPPVPPNLSDEQEQDFPITAMPEDFLFMSVAGFGTYFLKPKNQDAIVEIFTDYEGGGALSMCQEFMMISFSYDFRFTVGQTDYLEEVNLTSVPANKKKMDEIKISTDTFALEKFEVWTTLKGQKATLASGLDLKTKISKSLCVQSESSMKHPWINKASPYNLFRSRPVYMAPCHISVKQLSAIMLSRSISLNVPKCQGLKEELFFDQTIGEVYEKFRQDKVNSERQNNILDLGFNLERLHSMPEDESQPSTFSIEVQDMEEFEQRVSSAYKPENGFFTAFEELGGVQQFVSSTLGTLKHWKNQKLADMWVLWLKELQSFCEIPLYFQIFMKNKRGKDLLFKILAGIPDQQGEDTKKWEDEQREAVQFNYKVLSEAFSVADDAKIRDVAVAAGFLPRILDRIGAIAGEKPRVFEPKEQVVEEEEVVEAVVLERKKSYTKNTEKKKRKGVGYSSNQGVTFNVVEYMENKKVRSEQIQTLVDILSSFFNTETWQADSDVLDDILESALLPILENAFRNGSWLDMAKEQDLYHSYFALTRAICKQSALRHLLIELDQQYKPVQKDPVHKLLNALNDLAIIFQNVMSQQENLQSAEYGQAPQMLVKDVLKTQTVVQDAIEELLADREDDGFIDDALNMPQPEQYRALLKTLRFDYMDIVKHHYQSTAAQNKSPPASKMVRLAQELADLSNALPAEYTNSVFVRVDRGRVDLMKAMIAGATGTPYAHGLYEYDIFFENAYPTCSPKMNLTTTGAGQIRFNPNLYACGKVCLSLLGTWRGSATENWDPKISTTLQVLLSVQAIIMSEEVYFNEPGFENEAGTPEGEKKNEGYMNIVRYGNIKWAMLGHLKSPPPGFESVVKRHFYVKRADILTDVHAWLDLCDQNEAGYNGLVSDHNSTLAGDFRKSKDRYKEMLTEVIKELEEKLNSLEKPTNYQIKSKETKKKKKTKKQAQDITEGMQKLDDVDMGTDDEEEMINTGEQKSQPKNKDIDIEDEAVKDRWSRYIGAMGIEAVKKQASAQIFLSGAGGLGIEIAKNVVLAGCKRFTLHDTQPISQRDLSAQFFLNENDKAATRGEACINRLSGLNSYVRTQCAPSTPLPKDHAELEKEPWKLHEYQVVILSECDYETISAVNAFCHKKGIKFITCDAAGVFGRVFNDFTGEFEVLDKNGEELPDMMVKTISNEEQGVVEIIPTAKHKFEDGDECAFTLVEGMKLKQGEKHEDPELKSDGINDTIHKVKVISPYKFSIGDTRKFEKYEGNGIVKQLRTKLKMAFKPFEETMLKGEEALPADMNLAVADFEKMAHNLLSHIAFEALDKFRTAKKALPKPWDLEDAAEFVKIAESIAKRYGQKPEEWKKDELELKFFHLFAFQCQGVFNPLCAFFGGFVAQEIVKAITQKFVPTQQVFYYDSSEVLPEFDLEKHIETEDNKEFFEKEYIAKMIRPRPVGHRSDGLRICLGEDMINSLANCKLFMVGAGAIGCELLKNYAMCGVGTAKPSATSSGGSIVLTDPDIIEVSNLNRQFLFREKHLRKPKSQTAAAAAQHMNSELKGRIVARLDMVHEGTAHIFTDKFYQDLSVVTNALDNVKARLYIDARCVTARTPLLESGTLGPKGHVQVILPGLTESYGSMADPEDNTEIPHCTLKMFPEETLHCIEWARDKFGKMFTQAPKSAIKILEEGKNINPVSQADNVALKDGLKLLRKRPKNFSDCIEFSRMKFEKLYSHDIQQLLHVYPLDAKTKEGALFWALPKRSPIPIDFDKDNLLHCSFVSSMACLFAKQFFIEIPSKTPRTDEFKKHCGELASAFKPPKFVPNEAKAKEIQNSVASQGKQEEEKKEEQAETEEPEVNLDDLQKAKAEFLELYNTLPIDPKKEFGDYLVNTEEFEKDEDSNFHIDFMHSIGNCRATNYKLESMDWITVKLKAGRIVPALATTTACVAGLQTLELVKIMQTAKKVDHRNIFLNLAVPFMQASEPADVMKEKLIEGLETNLWDRWDVKLGKEVTLQNMIAHIEETYKGLEVRDVLKGSTPLYFAALMNAAGKEKEKQKLLASKVFEVTDCDKDDTYVDVRVTCIVKGDEEAKIITGVPPVRVFFNEEQEKAI